MSAPDVELRALLEATWSRNLVRVLGRLDRVAAALDRLTDDGDVTAEDVADAHTLAGALGTYGRPGSDLLRRAELLLSGARDDPAHVAEQVRALRAELA
jgi:hypothetical protein